MDTKRQPSSEALLLPARDLGSAGGNSPHLVPNRLADEHVGRRPRAAHRAQRVMRPCARILAPRPLNSMLVAQRITLPQMTVQLVVLPLHAANNYGTGTGTAPTVAP